ncbi:MAG: hypothetical protein WA642_03770 [Steroidobacteraceae bacterium]
MKRKINHQVTLKPQDLMVLFKLLSVGEKSNTYTSLSDALGVSSSEVHASIGRARSARLLNVENDQPLVVRAALKEFLLHGAKYAFPATLGPPARGIPTAYAAPPLVTLVSQPGELPPVWPDVGGNQRGVTFYPLYPTAPYAARKDGVLYEFLALFDALRGGAARERQLAARILTERVA